MIRIALLLGTLACAATGWADGASARSDFERSMLACCANGTYMRHYSHAPESARYDRETGTADYLFVLSYRGSTRAYFIEGRVSAGKFVSGWRRIFGRKPEAVSVEAFERLRETEPMLAIRLDGTRCPYVCLYPSRDFERSKPYPDITSLRSESPANEMLGGLPPGSYYTVRAGALRFWGFGCRTVYRGADGVEVDLGETAYGRTVSDILAKCRAALEMRYPDRVGQVSDRDVMDWCRTCTVTYEPVSSFYGTW